MGRTQILAEDELWLLTKRLLVEARAGFGGFGKDGALRIRHDVDAEVSPPRKDVAELLLCLNIQEVDFHFVFAALANAIGEEFTVRTGLLDADGLGSAPDVRIDKNFILSGNAAADEQNRLILLRRALHEEE